MLKLSYGLVTLICLHAYITGDPLSGITDIKNLAIRRNSHVTLVKHTHRKLKCGEESTLPVTNLNRYTIDTFAQMIMMASSNMIDLVQFSSTHGQNITLTNSSKTATWTSKNSSGWACSAIPLEKGQTVVVKLEGSGHCDLGVVTEDPKCLNLMKQTTAFKQINDIRIHKRTCTIPIILNDKGIEVSSRFQDKTFTKSLDQESKIWLILYVKFGMLSAKLLLNGSPDNPIQFSGNHGVNIRLEENNCLASTVLKNPASMCFVKDKISVGEELVFQCSPSLEQGNREPSRYHVKLYVYEKNPESLKKDFRYLFDSGKPVASEPPVTTLEVFEKDECKGQLVVSLICNTTVGYRAASSKYNEQRLRDNVTDGVWIILELFRTTVTVGRRAQSIPVANSNVPDSAVRDPSNVNAENSIDPFLSWQERTELKRQVSDYSEVSDARSPEPEDNVNERLMTLERSHQQLHASVDALSQTMKAAVTCSTLSMSPPAAGSFQTAATSSGRHIETCDRVINVRPNYTKLVKDMHCVPLCDKLFEEQIITQNEYQNITSETCEPDANRKLLLTIVKKNVMKSKMDKVLDETEQGHLKNLF